MPPQCCANLCLHEEENIKGVLKDIVFCHDIVCVQLHRDCFIWISDIWFRCETRHFGVIQPYTWCTCSCYWSGSQDVHNLSHFAVCWQVWMVVCFLILMTEIYSICKVILYLCILWTHPTPSDTKFAAQVYYLLSWTNYSSYLTN